jgi:hypothetical protein
MKHTLIKNGVPAKTKLPLPGTTGSVIFGFDKAPPSAASAPEQVRKNKKPKATSYMKVSSFKFQISNFKFQVFTDY